MKREYYDDDFLGTTTETTQYFKTREEMHKAAREALKDISMYPEITVDTWDKVQIEFSDFGSNDVTIKNFVWAPEDRSEEEDVLKIFENIGAVFHDKSAYYTVGKPVETAREVREIYVIIPDGWEVFKSFSGKEMISNPYERDVELWEALSCVDGKPALKIQKRDGETVIKMLSEKE